MAGKPKRRSQQPAPVSVAAPADPKPIKYRLGDLESMPAELVALDWLSSKPFNRSRSLSAAVRLACMLARLSETSPLFAFGWVTSR